MLRIRLSRRGKRGKPSYRIVVIPSTASRDGRNVDDLGYYNPIPNPSELKVDSDRARKWITNGAQPSDRVWKLLEIAEPGFKEKLSQKNGSSAAPEKQAAEPKEKAASKPRSTTKARAVTKSKAGTASKSSAKPAKAKAATAKAKAKASTKKTAPKARSKS